MKKVSTATVFRLISLVCTLLSSVFLLSGWIVVEVWGGSHNYSVLELTKALKALSSLSFLEELKIASIAVKCVFITALIENAFSLFYVIIPLKKYSPKRLSFMMTYITSALILVGMIYIGFEHIHPNMSLGFAIVFSIVSALCYSKYFKTVTADTNGKDRKENRPRSSE